MKFKITKDMILKILKRSYACPIDFLKAESMHRGPSILVEAKKYFDCAMRNCKIAVIETATVIPRPEVRDDCWGNFYDFIEGRWNEKTKEKKEGN